MLVITETLSDTLIVYTILKKLVKPYVEWDAYAVGIIDDKGNKLKDPVTSAQREAWNSFERLMWHIRKIMEKFVGQSKMAKYLTMAYLLKDDLNFMVYDGKFVDKYLTEMNSVDQLNIFNTISKIKELNIKSDKLLDEKLNVNKYYRLVESILDEKELTYYNEIMAEETVSGDIATSPEIIGLKKPKNKITNQKRIKLKNAQLIGTKS